MSKVITQPQREARREPRGRVRGVGSTCNDRRREDRDDACKGGIHACRPKFPRRVESRLSTGDVACSSLVRNRGLLGSLPSSRSHAFEDFPHSAIVMLTCIIQ